MAWMRLVFLFLLAAALAMLYWSTLLIEGDLKEIKEEIGEIKEQLEEAEAPREEGPEGGRSASPSPPGEDLLKPDPFYLKTLPRLLGSSFEAKGSLVQAVVGKPSNLHPFSNWSHVSEWTGLCQVSVSKNLFGKYETMSPYAALSLEERQKPDGSREFLVRLRDDLYWEPLDPSLFPHELKLSPHFQKRRRVTAHDFKFYLDALLNPHNQEAGALALRSYFGDLETMEVVDDSTFFVSWRPNGKGEVPYTAKLMTGALQPLARFVYQHDPNGEKILKEDSAEDAYRSSSLWAQQFSEHWARNIIPSCGAWIFRGMSDREVRFERNRSFFDPLAALLKERLFLFKEAPETVWQEFKAGKIDLVSLGPSQLSDWEAFSQSKEYAEQRERGLKIERIDYLLRSYSYIGWNLATPYFSSKKVRRAMTMALDRKRIISHILRGMGAPLTGPFFIDSKAYDRSIAPLPYDPDEARRLLEEEGWFDSDDDGILDKLIEGKRLPFRFKLTYYVKNPTSRAIAQFVASSLKKIGVACEPLGLEISDLSASFDEKSFSAILLGWSLGSPPEEPRQLWHSSGAEQKGSSNAVGFANGEADLLIERLQYEKEEAKRRELYHQFHRILHEEQPYTFLYVPKASLLYRSSLKNVFIPAKRQDLIPGADVEQPQSAIFWKSR